MTRFDGREEGVDHSREAPPHRLRQRPFHLAWRTRRPRASPQLWHCRKTRQASCLSPGRPFMLRARASGCLVAQLVRVRQIPGRLPSPGTPRARRPVHRRRPRPIQAAEVVEAAVLHEEGGPADEEDREVWLSQAHANPVRRGDGGTAHGVAPCPSSCRLCQMSLHLIHGEPR